MKISNTAQAMAWLDNSLISAAAEEAVPAKKRFKAGWMVVAACLCLALGSTALAVSLHLVNIRELDNANLRYSIEAQAENLPISAFAGAMMQELPEVFVRRFEADALDPYDPDNPAGKTPPALVFLDFASAAEAADYIGLEALTVPDWDYKQHSVKLLVAGDENGNIINVFLEGNYNTNGVGLVTGTNIHTENCGPEPADFGWSVRYGGFDNSKGSFTQSSYTTANGTECVIIKLDAPGDGLTFMDCYLVNRGILYTLRLSYCEDKAAYAETLMYQWADMFP